jgi:hypothetical protein
MSKKQGKTTGAETKRIAKRGNTKAAEGELNETFVESDIGKNDTSESERDDDNSAGESEGSDGEEEIEDEIDGAQEKEDKGKAEKQGETKEEEAQRIAREQRVADEKKAADERNDASNLTQQRTTTQTQNTPSISSSKTSQVSLGGVGNKLPGIGEKSGKTYTQRKGGQKGSIGSKPKPEEVKTQPHTKRTMQTGDTSRQLLVPPTLFVRDESRSGNSNIPNRPTYPSSGPINSGRANEQSNRVKAYFKGKFKGKEDEDVLGFIDEALLWQRRQGATDEETYEEMASGLKGRAATWFNRERPESIKAIIEGLKETFAVKRNYAETLMKLRAMTQGETETIRAWSMRVQEVCDEVGLSYDDAVAKETIVYGL